MRISVKHVLSEYQKHDYSLIDYCESAHAVLVKTESVNKKIEKKAIVLLLAESYNLRSSFDAKKIASQLLHKTHEDNIDKENVFIIVWGAGGLAHHFASNRIAYFNWDKRTVSKKFYSGKIKGDVEILKNIFKAEHYFYETYEAKHPEQRLYGTLLIWLIIAATVYTFFRTMLQSNIYGYCPNSLMNGQTYRFITYMFAHGSIMHLVGNMVSLFVFGRVYIRREGPLSFAVIYFVGGVMAGVLDAYYCLSISHDIAIYTVGASGGIMAILGAIVSECFTHPDFEKRRGYFLSLITVLLIINNIGAGINVRCHIFGFMSGILLGFVTSIISTLDAEERIRRFDKKKKKISGIRSSFINGN